MNKKLTKKFATLSLALSLIYTPLNFQKVEATDFEGNETKYYEMCVANKLSINDKKTCQEFNKYLRDRGTQLEKELQDAKTKKADTENSINDLQAKIKAIDDEVDAINDKIAYYEKDILNLENQIYEKKEKLKDNMYAMQSNMNSNAYIDYIFGAKSFADFLSRTATVKELNEYENAIIKEIKAAQKEVVKQRNAMEKDKENLLVKQTEQQQLQQQYVAQLEEQNESINNTQAQIDNNATSMALIDMNIDALNRASSESYIAGVINATPNQPIYETDANGNVVDVNNSTVGLAIANKALSKQGNMYVWGGAHSMSAVMNSDQVDFDCSGLVSWAHYQSGVNIGAQTTKTLVYMGKKIEKGNLQPGDIILFSSDGDYSGVHHVGIYIGNNQMVHAPCTGKPVQVADLNASYWQQQWFMARRLF